MSDLHLPQTPRLFLKAPCYHLCLQACLRLSYHDPLSLVLLSQIYLILFPIHGFHWLAILGLLMYLHSSNKSKASIHNLNEPSTQGHINSHTNTAAGPLCSPGLGTIAYPLLAISKYVAGLQLNLTMATPSHCLPTGMPRFLRSRDEQAAGKLKKLEPQPSSYGLNAWTRPE